MAYSFCYSPEVAVQFLTRAQTLSFKILHFTTAVQCSSAVEVDNSYIKYTGDSRLQEEG